MALVARKDSPFWIVDDTEKQPKYPSGILKVVEENEKKEGQRRKVRKRESLRVAVYFVYTRTIG